MKRSLLLLALLTVASTLVYSSDTAKTFSFNTSLFVENDVEIMSRLSGVVEEILVDRGSPVRKGTPLARLDNRDLKLQMERAQTIMQEAQRDYERAKSLYDQDLLSASEYDSKRLAFERARAESDLSKVDYEKSIIVAPFDGIVVEKHVHLGQRVVEDDNVPLFRVTAMRPLLARIYVTEEQIVSLKRGTSAEFVPTLSEAPKVPARVRWISSVIDPASGLAPVILEIKPGPGPDFLKPGMAGKIVISVQ